MTIKQKQCLLYILGYYVGEIDGDWGQLSKTACKAFQKDYGLTADGVFGSATEKKARAAVASGEVAKPVPVKDSWEDIEFFSKKEFRCKCGGKYCDGYPAEIDMDMVKDANEIRRRLGIALPVNSGLRCSRWNALQGGAGSSQHLYGLAVDLGCPKGTTPAKMYEIAEDVIGDTGGIGLYSWGIHIDRRKTKARWKG